MLRLPAAVLRGSSIAPASRRAAQRINSRFASSSSTASGAQSFLSSRAALASVTVVSVGSIAWYTHLYGTLPFIGEVSANSPAEDGLHPPAYPWSHKGLLDTFDHAR